MISRRRTARSPRRDVPSVRLVTARATEFVARRSSSVPQAGDRLVAKGIVPLEVPRLRKRSCSPMHELRGEHRVTRRMRAQPPKRAIESGDLRGMVGVA